LKVLSKATIYGLRALIYVASRSDGDRYVNIGEISTELDISFHFLTKTFQVLTQNGILESHRGPHGGVLLKKPMDQIFLIEFSTYFGGPGFFFKMFIRTSRLWFEGTLSGTQFLERGKGIFRD
jgi:Rrf2 family iron-sulfur cluster assembly transcriptional regulator